MAFKASAVNYEKGEKSTDFFYRQYKKKIATTNIDKLETEDGITEHGDKIRETIERIYKDKFKEDIEVTDRIKKMKEDKKLMFGKIDLKDLPKLTENQRKEIDKPITKAEIDIVVRKHLKTGKSPGSNGFTAEFFKTFWEYIGDLVFDSLKEGLEKKKLSESQRRGVIQLIEKKGKDRTQLDNWRPLTLINIDTKILSKALALRTSVYQFHVFSVPLPSIRYVPDFSSSTRSN